MNIVFIVFLNWININLFPTICNDSLPLIICDVSDLFTFVGSAHCNKEMLVYS